MQNKMVKTVTGSGEDIVIIHGGLANADDMQPIVDALSPYFKVTNINLPGSGHSDWHDSIKTIHDVADYALTELPEHATYIGWSKGGLTGQSIAARHPDRIKRLIGIGTSPKFIATDDWIGVPPPGFESIVMPLVKDGSNVDAFVRGAFEAEFADMNPKPRLYQWAMDRCNGSRPDIPAHIIQKLMIMVDTTDLRKEFKTISCPFDIIMGTEDPNVPATAFAQIKALNPQVKIHEIKGAHHAPFFTHEKEFNQILYKILNITK